MPLCAHGTEKHALMHRVTAQARRLRTISLPSPRLEHRRWCFVQRVVDATAGRTSEEKAIIYSSESWRLVREVLSSRRPASHLQHFFELWRKYQADQLQPNSKMLSSIIIAYTYTRCYALAMEMHFCFPQVKLNGIAYQCLLHVCV